MPTVFFSADYFLYKTILFGILEHCQNNNKKHAVIK